MLFWIHVSFERHLQMMFKISSVVHLRKLSTLKITWLKTVSEITTLQCGKMMVIRMTKSNFGTIPWTISIHLDLDNQAPQAVKRYNCSWLGAKNSRKNVLNIKYHFFPRHLGFYFFSKIWLSETLFSAFCCFAKGKVTQNDVATPFMFKKVWTCVIPQEG